jgi:hypothetical protein|tara:strand:+ start:452 stop:742 length:291 start_codon:yes stop_codon:yes gene_type:complete
MVNFVTPTGAEIAAAVHTDSAGVPALLNINKARTVRCVNTNATTAYLVTIQTAGNVLKGSMTLAPMESVVVIKAKSDEIFAANTAVKLSPVDFPRG